MCIFAETCATACCLRNALDGTDSFFTGFLTPLYHITKSRYGPQKEVGLKLQSTLSTASLTNKKMQDGVSFCLMPQMPSTHSTGKQPCGKLGIFGLVAVVFFSTRIRDGLHSCYLDRTAFCTARKAPHRATLCRWHFMPSGFCLWFEISRTYRGGFRCGMPMTLTVLAGWNYSVFGLILLSSKDRSLDTSLSPARVPLWLPPSSYKKPRICLTILEFE